MTELSMQGALLVMWIAFAAMALLGITAVLVWAVRSRQFSGQDRARFLALEAGKPVGNEAGKDGGKHVST